MPPKAAIQKKGARASKPKPKPLGRSSGNAVKKPARKNPNSKNTKDTTKKRGSASQSLQSEPQVASKPADAERHNVENRANYLLYCRASDTSDPTIFRLLSVPSTLRFDQLHLVMQVVFGWANCHMYTFRVEELQNDIPKDLRRPWPKTLLTIMAQIDIFSDESTQPTKCSDDVCLADIFEDEKYKEKSELVYEYDMGDSWLHDIVFLGRESPGVRKVMTIPDDFPIICLGGEGHPCIEDSGGPDGFEEMKKVLSKPRARDPEGWRQWYKTICANGDPKGFDPFKWDIFDVNEQLHELAKDPGFL